VKLLTLAVVMIEEPAGINSAARLDIKNIDFKDLAETPEMVEDGEDCGEQHRASGRAVEGKSISGLAARYRYHIV
jgi:hypothetical protein